MNPYFLLLTPRLHSLRNRLRKGEDGSGLKLLIMGLVTAAFWVGIFVGVAKVLGYFQASEGFGHVLARKLMSMVWLTFFSVLLFSNVITALSIFFMSRDLETIHSSPVSQESLFWARLTDTAVDSSWMVLFFGLPIFLAYGLVFKAGPLYYLAMLATTPAFLLLATSLATMLTMALVNIFPARRTRDILFLLGIMMVIILYMMFRFMRPEQLVNPDAFKSVVSYFASLDTPGSAYLPSHWATEALWPSLAGEAYNESGFYLLLLWSTAGAAAVAASWVAAALYGPGFSKSQEGARRIIPGRNPLDLFITMAGRPFGVDSRVMVVKDLKTFFRDNTQWSQMLLLMALVVIYLYNFSVLDLHRFPLKTYYLQNVISFLNVGLAAFVVASLGVRFVFPAVSMEGFSYWIIRSSPLSIERFLWTKFLIYAPPLVVLAEVLILVSNYLLDTTPFMTGLSAVTIFFLVLGLVGLGVGLGAVYPRFESENIAAVATGYGGMVYMIFSALYTAGVIVLEAWPVYAVIRSQFTNQPLTTSRMILMGFCFLGVIALNVTAIVVPMRRGAQALLDRESA